MGFLFLFKNALDLADSVWDDEDFEDLRCLILAILNNLGYIYSHRMDSSQASICIRSMCDMINSECEDLSLSEEDFELFFQSVFTYLDGSKLAVAPAA